MTHPPQASTNDAILLKLGEMGAQLAVITEQLKDVPDHETRLRALEKWRYGLPFAGLLAIASAGLSVWATLHH